MAFVLYADGMVKLIYPSCQPYTTSQKSKTSFFVKQLNHPTKRVVGFEGTGVEDGLAAAFHRDDCKHIGKFFLESFTLSFLST